MRQLTYNMQDMFHNNSSRSICIRQRGGCCDCSSSAFRLREEANLLSLGITLEEVQEVFKKLNKYIQWRRIISAFWWTFGSLVAIVLIIVMLGISIFASVQSQVQSSTKKRKTKGFAPSPSDYEMSTGALMAILGTSLFAVICVLFAFAIVFPWGTKREVEHSIFAAWQRKGLVTSVSYMSVKSRTSFFPWVELTLRLASHPSSSTTGGGAGHYHQQQQQQEQQQQQQQQQLVPMAAPAPIAPPSRPDPLEQIQRLKTLLENDAITQEEYDMKKTELLELV